MRNSNSDSEKCELVISASTDIAISQKITTFAICCGGSGTYFLFN